METIIGLLINIITIAAIILAVGKGIGKFKKVPWPLVIVLCVIAVIPIIASQVAAQL